MIDNIDYLLCETKPLDFWKENQILPISRNDLFTTVLSVNKKNIEVLEEIFETPIKLNIINKERINYELSFLDDKVGIYKLYTKSLKASNNDEKSYLLDFFDSLIIYSINKKASDIHIETTNDYLVIRIRVDGYLEKIFSFTKEFYPLLSSIIKLLSSLDISQKRKPQDGRFSRDINEKEFDFRVSIVPTISGESIVIRILDNTNVLNDINTLGFSKDHLEDINKVIKVNSGLVLVTGPTGSGKTTTLYSLLDQVNDNTKKIITIEDPVEYYIDNIQQINIHEEIGLSFSEILKNILRQDPDIIMIGEIRDKESLKIAVQAALTGHLVITTLHTNDSVSTISRLMDLGLEPYLIASTLKAVVSQRLVRKLCEHCKVEENYNEETIFKALGCDKCNLMGYASREVISEVLTVDEDISSLITQNASEQNILMNLKQKGFQTIYENGIQKVNKGITSLDEVQSLVDKK